ncbi:uncharacterized protein MONBRDRAFT_37907 [Monosiga brevicollis MX1]|uniref:SET domain-containing protein n=1 Tax=Monosiga brevicollis TaxID=81824 RepID=A9V4I8_MONBE|nr:uncharacterized protein MONBRDRAFT_37907 [Monosiga brevicollis MX1]EDQ87719.1 predicted protein [Monosiga brevicollis MX1]|eukprot:XP_001747639.1 hypothetical protein [Monosiga brevicollis MX1]
MAELVVPLTPLIPSPPPLTEPTSTSNNEVHANPTMTFLAAAQRVGCTVHPAVRFDADRKRPAAHLVALSGLSDPTHALCLSVDTQPLTACASFHLDLVAAPFHCHVDADVPKDTLMFALPLHLVLTPDPGTDLPNAGKHAGLVLTLAQRLHCQHDGHSHLSSLSHIRPEPEPEPPSKKTPESDFWRQYLAAAAVPDAALYWDEARVHALRGTNLAASLPTQQAELARQLAALHASDYAQRHQIPVTTLRHAHQLVLSRAFARDSLPPLPASFASHAAYLLPIFDALNHSHTLVNLRFVLEDQALGFRTTQPVPRGGRLYNTYGDRTNEELLCSYGFELAEPSCDAVTLALVLPDIPPASAAWLAQHLPRDWVTEPLAADKLRLRAVLRSDNWAWLILAILISEGLDLDGPLDSCQIQPLLQGLPHEFVKAGVAPLLQRLAALAQCTSAPATGAPGHLYVTGVQRICAHIQQQATALLAQCTDDSD